MAQPVAYVPVTSFIGYQGSQPWFPGQNIDIELQALKATTDQVRANLALIQRDDGALLNGSVGWLQLDTATQLAFTTGLAATGATIAMTDGQLLIGQTGANPLAKAISGDATLAKTGALTIAKIQGTTVASTTGTGSVVFSDSPNFSTAVVLARPSIGAVYADGIIARNPTAAAAGAQQFAPALRFSGQGWRTNATAQSEQVDWTLINEAVQGAADPTANLTYNFQVNGGGYSQAFRMGSSGVFNALTGFTVNGAATSANVLRGNGTNFVSAALAAADLSNGVTGTGAVVLVTSPTLVTPTLGVASATSVTAANGTANGFMLTAAAGTNGSLSMGTGGTVLFGLGSTADAFAVNDHSSNTIFNVAEGTPGTASTTAISSPGNLAILNTTAIPAGGTAAKGYLLSSATNFGIFFGSGVPTLAAAQGSLYLRSDGSSTSTRAYINTNGSTTWTNLVTAA